MNTRPNALDLVRQILAHRPCGLMTDIDGTISHVSDSPERATVEPAAKAALKKLASRIDVVAAVSGRSAHDAHSMVSLDELVYSGNHGMEIWTDGRLQQSRIASEHSPKIEELLDSLSSKLDVPGIYIENKVLTGSIHYRETSDPDSVRNSILEVVRPLADRRGLRITEGRMVIEIRPPVDLNKGTSAIELIDQFGLVSGVFLGDDVTDVDAFRALRERRARTGEHFYAIGVSSEETPESVIQNVDALVQGVNGVVQLLNAAGEIDSDVEQQ